MNAHERRTCFFGRRGDRLVPILLFAILCLAVHLVITTSPFGTVSPEKQGFRINDYDYKLQVIRSFWAGKISSIYRVDSQMAAIEEGFGVKLGEAMPIGDSPTVLLLFLPFSAVAKFGLPVALTLWNSVSLAVFFFALGRVGESIPDREIPSPMYFIVVCIFTFSYAMVYALLMRQTSLLACGIMILTVLEVNRAASDTRPPRLWAVLAGSLVLSVKIPYLVVLLGIFLFFGFFREAIAVCAAAAGEMVVLALWKGPGTILDWIAQIRLFSGGAIPGHYASSFNLHTQITLRSAAAQFTDSPFVVVASYGVLLAGCFLLFLAGCARPGIPSSLRKSVIGPSPQRLATALIGLLLLFLPHLGGYEDLLLLVPYAFVFLNRERQPRIGNIDRKFALAILCTAVVLNFNLFPLPRPIFFFWFLKLASVASLFLLVP